MAYNKSTGLINEGNPCRAIDVETKTEIARFPSRYAAAKHFSVGINIISNSIRNFGATQINGQWIAFRSIPNLITNKKP